MTTDPNVLHAEALDAAYKPFLLEGKPAGKHAEIVGRAGVRAGVLRLEPGEYPVGEPTPYVFEDDEYIWIIEGEVQVESSSGETVVLRAGDSAYFRKGSESIWTFHAPFRKFSVEIEIEIEGADS